MSDPITLKVNGEERQITVIHLSLLHHQERVWVHTVKTCVLFLLLIGFYR
jgi:hypothetical protein